MDFQEHENLSAISIISPFSLFTGFIWVLSQCPVLPVGAYPPMHVFMYIGQAQH